MPEMSHDALVYAFLTVTETLHIPLLGLRHTSQARTLWIDQICINQTDLQERSEQVRIMRQIYSKAQLVILWLGEDGDNNEAH